MKTVFYTAIYGGYDRLAEIPHRVYNAGKESGVDFLCFTDDWRLTSNTWTVLASQTKADPRAAAKFCKVNSHQILFDYCRSIWIDGSFRVLGPLWELFDEFSTDIGLFEHTCRTCLYDEIRDVRIKRKESPSVLGDVERRYEAAGCPKDAGLYMGGILLRRHTTAVARFNQEWWSEIRIGSLRDQISLPYVLNRQGLLRFVFSADSWRLFLKLRPHKGKRNADSSGNADVGFESTVPVQSHG